MRKLSLKSSCLSSNLKSLMAGAQTMPILIGWQHLTLDRQKNQIIGVSLPLLLVNEASDANNVTITESDPSGSHFCLQRAALQFQINLHFLFLHDCLQLCGSPGILMKERKKDIITIQFS